MLALQTPSDFLEHAGRKLGCSEWFTVEQRHIDGFAQLTGDDFWIHVDVERAAREMPGGKTIAHGLFILCWCPRCSGGSGASSGAARGSTTAPTGCAMKILAVNGVSRVEALPNVPTTAELGMPNVRVESNYGIVAPTGTPAAITQKVRDALVKVVNDPQVRKQLSAQGAIPMTTTPQEYRQLMDQESLKWATVVKKSNITLE